MQRMAAAFAGSPLAGDDVELAGIELAVERIRKTDGDVEIDVRVPAPKRREDVGHGALHQIVGGAEADPAAQLRSGELLFRRGMRLENKARMNQQGLAVL